MCIYIKTKNGFDRKYFELLHYIMQIIQGKNYSSTHIVGLSPVKFKSKLVNYTVARKPGPLGFVKMLTSSSTGKSLIHWYACAAIVLSASLQKPKRSKAERARFSW